METSLPKASTSGSDCQRVDSRVFFRAIFFTDRVPLYSWRGNLTRVAPKLPFGPSKNCKSWATKKAWKAPVEIVPAVWGKLTVPLRLQVTPDTPSPENTLPMSETCAISSFSVQNLIFMGPGNLGSAEVKAAILSPYFTISVERHGYPLGRFMETFQVKDSA